MSAVLHSIPRAGLAAHLANVGEQRLTFNAMSIGDDPTRTAAPDLKDAITVSEDQAVRCVVALLAFDMNTAFGKDRIWWREVLMDAVVDLQTVGLLVLIAPSTMPSLPAWASKELGKVITITANELLAKMDTEQLERVL